MRGRSSISWGGERCQVRELTVDEIMAILPETPRRIAALTEGLSPTELRAAPEPDAWSINDVLAHLRACHDVLGGSILRISPRTTRRGGA